MNEVKLAKFLFLNYFNSITFGVIVWDDKVEITVSKHLIEFIHPNTIIVRRFRKYLVWVEQVKRYEEFFSWDKVLEFKANTKKVLNLLGLFVKRMGYKRVGSLKGKGLYITYQIDKEMRLDELERLKWRVVNDLVGK